MNLRSRPDFSGTWVFNPGKSLLEILPPDTAVFVFDHREPVFRFSRTHVFSGTSDTLTLDLTTDGKEVVGEHGDLRFRSRMYWDGQMLVFETNAEEGANAGVNIVRYSLSETGDSILAEEQLRSKAMKYTNKWVFDRER